MPLIWQKSRWRWSLQNALVDQFKKVQQLGVHPHRPCTAASSTEGNGGGEQALYGLKAARLLRGFSANELWGLQGGSQKLPSPKK